MAKIRAPGNKCSRCNASATWELVWADGRGVVRSCADHKVEVRSSIARQPHACIVGWRRVRGTPTRRKRPTIASHRKHRLR